MTEEQRGDDRLYRILSEICTPKKMENFSFHVNPEIIPGCGFLSEFYTGEAHNKDSGEVTHLAIKVVPNSGFIDNYEDVFRNEVYFYSTIFPELDKFQRKKNVKQLFKNIPKYLCGHLYERKEFIIMENLTPARYAVFDRSKCLRSEHLKTIFTTYAKFHALSFVYKYKHPEEFNNLISGLIDITQSITSAEMVKSIEAAYQASVDTFSSELNSDVVERLRNVNVRQTVLNARKYYGNYACLIHGDCWLSNMLFKYKESGELEDMKLVDFQLVYVSTPVHDLSNFFYSGATKTDMDRIDYYLKIYYSNFSTFVTELGENPEKIYPFEALKEEWKRHSLLGVIVGIGMWVGKLMEKKELVSLLRRETRPKERYFKFWFAKMSEVNTDNFFRSRARDVCQHAVEYGII